MWLAGEAGQQERHTPFGSSQGSGWSQGGDSGVGLRTDTGQVRGAACG